MEDVCHRHKRLCTASSTLSFRSRSGVQKHRQVGQDDHQVLGKDAVVLHGMRGYH